MEEQKERQEQREQDVWVESLMERLAGIISLAAEKNIEAARLHLETSQRQAEREDRINKQLESIANMLAQHVKNCMSCPENQEKIVQMITERVPDVKEKRAWWEGVWLKIILGGLGLLVPLAALYQGYLEKTQINQNTIIANQIAISKALAQIHTEIEAKP